MLPNIKRILYATDLSENSQPAFRYAAGLGRQYEALIMALYVVEPVATNTFMNIGGIMGESELLRLQQDNEKRLFDDIHTKLYRFCDELQSPEAACPVLRENVFIRKGIPVEEILTLAKEKSADLIVMGTHGYGLFKDALMGGTVRRVLRHSRIPVLVARNPDAAVSE